MVRSKFSCSKVFSLHRYFIESTKTDIDMLCKLSWNSVVIVGLLQLLAQLCCFAHCWTIEWYVA